MKIDTKFDPSDHVWIINAGGIFKATIESIKVDATFDKLNIKYNLAIKGRKTTVQRHEDEIWSALDQLVHDVSAQA